MIPQKPVDYESEDIPPEFKYAMEALYWANELIESCINVSDETKPLLLSEISKYFVRAMAAAREDERERCQNEAF